MGDVHERDPDLPLEGLELELHLLAELEVECPEGLVQQKDRRMVDERAGEGDPLLLAAGQLPCPALAVARQANELECLVDSALFFGATDLLLAQAVAHILGNVHVREEGVVLEDRVDVPPIRGHPGDRPAGQDDLTGGRLLEARDHPERRRLAATGRAKEAVERAAGDAQVHPVDCRHVAELLRDTDDLDVRMTAVDRAGGGR